MNDVIRQQLGNAFKFHPVEMHEMRPGKLVQRHQPIDASISQVHAVLAALLMVDLEIGKHLLKGQLEGIADVVEQRGQTPDLQEQVGRFALIRGLLAVEVPERIPVGPVGLIDRQPQRKHVHGVGIVVPVLHQQRTAVGLVLREQLHHLLGFAILPQEHVDVAEIHGVGVLRRAGVDEVAQGLLQAQTIHVHLHVIGDLIRVQARAHIDAVRLLSSLNVRVVTQPLAALPQEAQRRGFQVVLLLAPVHRRLHRSQVRPIALFVDLPHGFERRVCHM